MSHTPLTDPFFVSAKTHSKQRLWQKALGQSAYHWLLTAVALVLVIHMFWLPIWLSVAAVISLIAQSITLRQWLNQKTRQRQRQLYHAMQVLGLIIGMTGIWFGFGRSINVNVSIAFLVLCLILKLWEINKRRDAYVVLNLNLFVLSAVFLWTQGLATTLFATIGLIGTLLAFIALSDDDNATGAGRLRSLGLLCVPALPLLLVLFLFVPRIPPLWAAPNLGQQQAKTGISDSMSPGDFANLSKSTELAFRVEFDGTIPNRQQLYWRAMVFSDFDGTTWRANPTPNDIWHSEQTPPDWAKDLSHNGQAYQVFLEPTHQHWLPALEHSRLRPKTGLVTTRDLTYRSYTPISERTNFQAIHQPPALSQPKLDKQTRLVNLNLPKNGNPKAHALAQKFYQDSHGDPKVMIEKIYSHIHQGNFRYTLSPPTLQGERIDEFLFDTQAGFCEHYTAGFVFLMRAAGVPARVITGYQGGELGRDGKSWEVRQMDAHAWAEVWLDDTGWVRIDPTSFVAPERIDDGMNALTDSVGAAMFGDGIGATLGYRQFRLLQSIRRLSDQASYYWQRDIVGFDQDKQQDALWRLFHIQNLKQQLLYLFVGFGVAVAAFVMIFLYQRRVIHHPFDLPIVKLSHALGKKDPTLGKKTAETPMAYLGRLANLSQKPQDFAHLSATYRQYRYGRMASQTSDRTYKQNQKQFAKTIAQLKKHF